MPRKSPSWSAVYIKLPFKINVPPIEYGLEIKSQGSKINFNIPPVLKIKELLQVLNVKEIRYTILNTQSVVYLFKCIRVMQITRHLYQRFIEHRYSAIRKHLTSTYGPDKSKSIDYPFQF